MKLAIVTMLLVLVFSCKDRRQKAVNEVDNTADNRIEKPEFQALIDSFNVDGAILIYDLNDDKYYTNNYEWTDIGKLPASTFKIANTIIGLETGVIENDSIIFKWDGEPKWLSEWEQDLSLSDAFKFSCVHCYQEVSRKIGVKRMNEYVAKLNYGNLDISSQNIDEFWLLGESRISQMQQIDFLKRFYFNKLPISMRTSEFVKRIMIREKGSQYIVRGKTGLSNENQNYNGWYVGYVETVGNVYFFATNLEPQENFELNQFIQTRIDLTKHALRIIKVIG